MASVDYLRTDIELVGGVIEFGIGMALLLSSRMKLNTG